MHGAPSVSYPVGRSHFGAALHGLAWLAGLVVIAAWCWVAPQARTLQLGAVAVWIVAGLLAWHAWRTAPSGLLAWDGEGWRWADGTGESAGALNVALDLQRRMLVQWRAHREAHARWLWLEAKREPNAWIALRRAVYSPASTDSLRPAPQSHFAAKP